MNDTEQIEFKEYPVKPIIRLGYYPANDTPIRFMDWRQAESGELYTVIAGKTFTVKDVIDILTDIAKKDK